MYDVIILGAGPAGLTAGIYAARAGLNTLIIEKGQVGGQIALTFDVDNYPGILEAKGPLFTKDMLTQAENFGAKKINDTINEIYLDGNIKVLKSEKNEYKTKALIYATGANPRKLGIPGEDEFLSKGVGYCATCDGAFYQNADIYVVGGGDAAVEEAIFLTKFAKRVIILYRGSELKAAKNIQDRAKSTGKIEVRYNEEVIEIKGDLFVKSIVVKNNKTGEINEYTNNAGEPDIGLFIFAGYIPNTDLVKDIIKLDQGYVDANEDTLTSVEGIFAAGDVRKKNVRQVVTATADGAVSAIAAEKYVEKFKE